MTFPALLRPSDRRLCYGGGSGAVDWFAGTWSEMFVAAGRLLGGYTVVAVGDFDFDFNVVGGCA